MVQHHFEHNKVTMASLCTPVQNYFELEGTMSLIQRDMVGCIIDTGDDDYGQWVYSKLAAKNKQVITVVMAYQLCKISKKNGNTTYHQQVAQLQQNDCRMYPRKAFMLDLQDFLRKCTAQGEKLIVG
eukprot:14029905-Ditylum_brightwellii.AAC.1